MASVLLHYAIEATPLAVLMYAIAWRIVGRRAGQRLRLRSGWHFVGCAATASVAAAARLTAAFIFGGRAMQELWTNQGIGLIGPVGVPFVIAAGVCALLKAKARP